MPVQISLNPAGTIHGRNTKVRGAYWVFPYGIPCALDASGPGAGKTSCAFADGFGTVVQCIHGNGLRPEKFADTAQHPGTQHVGQPGILLHVAAGFHKGSAGLGDHLIPSFASFHLSRSDCSRCLISPESLTMRLMPSQMPSMTFIWGVVSST